MIFRLIFFFIFGFSNNRIGVDGALALAKGLDANNTLEILQVIFAIVKSSKAAKFYKDIQKDIQK